MADISALIAYLTEGLEPDQAKAVEAALKNEKVASRAATMKQQSEYDAIAAQAKELTEALDGVDAKGDPKGYRVWYKKYYGTIQEQNQLVAAYQEKYGTLENPKTAPAAATGAAMTPEEINKLVNERAAAVVDERIQNGYAGRWSSLIEGNGQILQKHFLAGRKTPIDFKKVAELAATKWNGDLEKAYDEYDAPEREKERAASTEAEIERRVKERVQKAGAERYLPGGADATPGPFSRNRGSDKFDQRAMDADLIRVFTTGEDTPAVN